MHQKDTRIFNLEPPCSPPAGPVHCTSRRISIQKGRDSFHWRVPLQFLCVARRVICSIPAANAPYVAAVNMYGMGVVLSGRNIAIFPDDVNDLSDLSRK